MKEVTVGELATHLGVKPQNMRPLINKWLEGDFIQIENASKKARTYSLTPQWEQILLNRQQSRLRDLGHSNDLDIEL